MKKQKSIEDQRAEWLLRKKLTIRQFAENTGNDFGTAYLWFQSDRTPRRKYLAPVLAKYPDWPHA